ncbi:class I SAM-dependent methyltransferase [Lancefieldella parvula]|uniref:class I SAM-dependent methyltransferase n=1 Tax=Lancefieldella parvula TaxID=1382 RepID=UPI0028D8D6E4|nr:class I SAM-dependent methyltransferase [Lancefieldella parvula]
METSSNKTYTQSISASTAEQLSYVTSEFYTQQAQSFSATRQMPWQGWQQCLDAMPQLSAGEKLSVLDVGCGNLRFARFLCDEVGIVPAKYFAVDNCKPLVESGEVGTHISELIFIELDVIKSLLDNTLSSRLTVPACDLVVAFGFLHHVPGAQKRIQLLRTLLEKTKPGRFVCISFWQFMNSQKLAAKAQKTTAQGLHALGIDASELEEHDYLIGWQDKADTWRYCHHFSQDELDELLGSLGSDVRVCAQFSADGKDNNLNRYVILQRL